MIVPWRSCVSVAAQIWFTPTDSSARKHCAMAMVLPDKR